MVLLYYYFSKLYTHTNIKVLINNQRCRRCRHRHRHRQRHRRHY